MHVATLVDMRAAPIFLLLLISTACAKERERERPASRERARPESTLTGTLPKQMRNCPSAVPTAKTSAVPTDKGVDVVITAPELDARHRILTLAELHASQREPIAMLGEHNGMHGGPGTMGRCPIIHANTTVKLEPIPDGVRIHVTANDKDDIQALQKATDARVRTLQLPSS